MTEFVTSITERIARTRSTLSRAESCGDDYLAEVSLGELESLARLAADHGVTVAGLAESLEAHGVRTPAVGLPLPGATAGR